MYTVKKNCTTGLDKHNFVDFMLRNNHLFLISHEEHETFWIVDRLSLALKVHGYNTAGFGILL